MNIVKHAPFTILPWKICIGTSGVDAPFHCHATKATEVANPAIRVAMTCAEFHSYSPPPQVKPSSKTEVPPRAKSAPKKSIAFSLTFQSPVTFRRGIKNKTANVVNAVSGRFKRKIHRHESCEMEASAPPTTGPMPLAIATTAPRIPWYLPRSRRGTTSLTIICATVMRPPPPTPVKARKTINCVAVWAREAASDPTKKMARPTKSTSLRDQMSDSFPYSNWKHVDVLCRECQFDWVVSWPQTKRVLTRSNHLKSRRSGRWLLKHFLW